MARLVLAFLLAAFPGTVSAAGEPGMASFPVGVYGDDARLVTCVTGPPGTTFHQMAWVNVPNDLGLGYITLRFDLPANVDLTTRPVFHDLVSYVVFTDFADGSVEWNMLFEDCPSGWIRVYSQECTILDDEFSRIGIRGDVSLARDCDFVLNDVRVLNQLTINDPDCPPLAAEPVGWGGLKCTYR